MESGVGGEKSHHHPLDGLQVLGIEHSAGHLHGVNHIARTERIGVLSHRVALVVVLDGIAEVDGVGGIGLQRIKEVHLHALALGPHVGSLYLRRGNHHLLVGAFQFHIFIEKDAHLLLGHTHCPVGRHARHHHGRLFVVASAIGIADAGTRHGQQGCPQGDEET